MSLVLVDGIVGVYRQRKSASCELGGCINLPVQLSSEGEEMFFSSNLGKLAHTSTITRPVPSLRCSALTLHQHQCVDRFLARFRIAKFPFRFRH